MHGGAVAIEHASTPGSTSTDKSFERTWFALAVAVMLHAVLLNSVMRRPRPAQAEVASSAMVWLKIAPPVHKSVAPPPPRPPVIQAPPRRSVGKPAAAAPATVPRDEAPVAAPVPATISMEQILRQAKHDLGKIDRQLRKEAGAKDGFSASPDSPLQRLARGIEQAHDMAPNKWYQAARIEDITPPGDDARKIYRITSVLAGTYCVRYPDKNKIGAQGGAANLGEPLIGSCPRMF